MRSHAIIVQSWAAGKLGAARAEALKIFADVAAVTEITPESINGYSCFMVAPDGSKEGWAHSSAGDDCRAKFKAYMRGTNSADGGAYLKWCEVMFADDDGAAAVVDYSEK